MGSIIENNDIEILVFQLLNDFMNTFHINTETVKDKLSRFVQQYKVIERNSNNNDNNDKNIYEKDINTDINLQNLSIDSNRVFCQIETKKGCRCKNKTFKNSPYCKLHLHYMNSSKSSENKDFQKKNYEKQLCHHKFLKGPRIGERCNKICDCEEKYCYLHKKS